MNLEEKQTWNTLLALEIDDKNSSLKFSDRLANENTWSKKFAKEALEEYKKFVFLSKHAGHPVTPSCEVDEVWHLHMIYTRSYWLDMCANINFQLHHGPTKGGKKEEDKFINWYDKTLESYRKYFGEPPVEYWPSSEHRFSSSNVVKVDKTNFLILKRIRLKRALAACSLVPMFILLMSSTGWAWLIGILMFAAAWLIIALIVSAFRSDSKKKKKKKKDDGSGCSSSSGCGNWLLFSCGTSCSSSSDSSSFGGGDSGGGGSSGSSGCSSSSSSSCSSSSSSCGSSCGGGCGGD